MLAAVQVLLLAVFPALGWVILTQQVNLAGLLIGYVIGAGLVGMMMTRTERRFNPRSLPRQAFGLLVYIVVLLWDIWNSGIDVLFRVIGMRPVNPGILRVSVQDESEIVAGLSAHGITITPGQLVVDFDEQQGVVYVHCLDVEANIPKIEQEQSRRLKYLRSFVK
jgi:multisubunit Na+/H+ antiporter MnhE subunit